jgi:hypothetical protein
MKGEIHGLGAENGMVWWLWLLLAGGIDISTGCWDDFEFELGQWQLESRWKRMPVIVVAGKASP